MKNYCMHTQKAVDALISSTTKNKITPSARSHWQCTPGTASCCKKLYLREGGVQFSGAP